jgi:hypothetical protein
MVPVRLSRLKVFRNEIIISGSGKPFQSFDILDGRISEAIVWVDEISVLSERVRNALERYRTVQIKSEESGTVTEFWLEWKPVRDLSGSGPDDAVFTVVENSDNSASVLFGDGQNGRVPPSGRHNIRIEYTTGSGRSGYVSEWKIPIVSGPGASPGRISNPQPESGGADCEPAEEPISKVPKALKNPRHIVFPKSIPHLREDRFLRPEVNVKLQEICTSIKKQSLVHFHRVSGTRPKQKIKLFLFFSGPSEAAKIIAATQIAYESGLYLFRIDLSSVVAKYIGETEKNLNAVFSEADASNAILLFDEADALFGKRLKFRGACDRYATSELKYLLRKIEEYEGIVILTTHCPSHFNKDFRERIDFFVDFP